MTAVVRGSSGEPVILLAGDTHRHLSQAALTDVLKAAAAVCSAAELEAVAEVAGRLGDGPADFHVRVGGDVLAVYRLPVT
ncbi:hypothetical protein [Streptomyces sp. NPDC004065]|uniref:hypothetical protein n=1 Tax=Streptomyces sp. NPDC004065 TaxID=3364689 RepID=UPI00385067A4